MTMMNKPVGIIGTGSFLPDNVVTNFDLEKMVDTNDQWIRERTGIEERRIAPEGMNTSYMATEAAKKAMQMANVTAEEIDMIIFATLTPDMIIPSAACVLQANLGAKNAAAYDLQAACSGFVYGLITAASYISSGIYKKVLVVGAEILSRRVNWNDRGTCILFGDGAGAAVVSEVPEGYGIKGIDMGADGTGGPALCIPAGGTAVVANDQRVEEGLTFIHMDGPEVYKFAVKTMGRTVLKSLERAGMELNELDYFIPHQANIRIIDSAAKRLHLPMEKVFVNLHKYGNTGHIKMIKTDICDLLQIEYPIFQGGMAWLGTAELAAAVSEAGGLGIIGAGHMPPDIFRNEIHKLKERTSKPFGCNIMLMSPFVKEVMEVVVEERVPVITTGAGNPGVYVPALKEIGTKVIPVVASVLLAKRLLRGGIDAIIAEGTESGGHVGDITTMALIPQVVDAVDVPVIAAGGIADGRGMAAAFALGAKAVQMGTRFVLSEECIAHENYKNAVLKAKDRATVMTGLTTGHPVRIIDNALAHKYKSLEFSGGSKEELEALGAGTLRLAAIDGNIKEGSVMIGQISGMLTDVKPCETIIKDIMTEAETVIKNLQGLSK